MKTIQTLRRIILLMASSFLLQDVSSQTPWYLNGNFTANDWIGTSNSMPFPIYTGNLQRMVVNPIGLVGIGTAFSPSHLLDVNGGNININTPAKGYMINGNYVLWHNGVAQNISVGDNAGTGGINNTFVGYEAAGNSVQTWGNNTMLGTFAGWNSNGQHNTFLGVEAGRDFNEGVYNTYVGSQSQITTTGHNYASTLGARTFVHSDHSTAIGAETVAMDPNSVILGSQADNVGIGLSGITPGPLNKMEINGMDGPGPNNVDDVPGVSGLRFRDLTKNSTVVANPGPGILSVSKDGDVLYVPAGNFGYCSISPTVLTDDAAMKLSNYNVYFEGQTPGRDMVGIGISCGTVLKAKLDVSQTTNLVGINAVNTSGLVLATAIRGKANNAENCVGVEGLVDGGTRQYAVRGVASNPATGFANYGGEFVALGDGANYGVSGHADGTDYANYGGFFNAQGAATVNYGVRASAINATTNWAGYFDGDVYATGSYLPSDSTLKQNINTVSNATSLIMQLEPKSYNYNTSSYPYLSLPAGIHYGFLAQDVQAVFPAAVKNVVHSETFDHLGNSLSPTLSFKGINYDYFIALLIAAVKEQNQSIEDLKEEIKACCNLPDNELFRKANSNEKDVTLADLNVVILKQNAPNPFAEKTTIGYLIPENSGYAQVIFYDQLGRIIKTVDITEKGEGLLNVFAPDLSSGIYAYSLVIDGKLVETKQMLKAK